MHYLCPIFLKAATETMIRHTIYIIYVLLLLFPLTTKAQSNWELPVDPANPTNEETSSTAQTDKKEKGKSKKELANEADLPYLKGAVPEKDGKVVFSADVETAGTTAAEAYQKAYKYMYDLAKKDMQTDKSAIAIVDKENCNIVGTYVEKLTFRKQMLSLDQTDFGYIIVANCTDGNVHISIERLYYDYFTGKTTEHINAEDIITDELMLNKDGTKLKKYNSRFRRATVDRMQEIISDFRKALQ